MRHHRSSLKPVRTASRSRQRGSVFVELSLVFMVLACLLIGTLDFGQFLFIHQMLTERARSAVRYGVTTSPIDTTGVQNMVLYGQTTAGSGAGIFGLTSDMVLVNVYNANTDDYRLTVKVTNFPYTVLSPYISGTYNGPDIVADLPLGANF
jgi:Flp pilus assembly protein TadG